MFLTLFVLPRLGFRAMKTQALNIGGHGLVVQEKVLETL
jgi:hypothetical protein